MTNAVCYQSFICCVVDEDVTSLVSAGASCTTSSRFNARWNCDNAINQVIADTELGESNQALPFHHQNENVTRSNAIQMNTDITYQIELF